MLCSSCNTRPGKPMHIEGAAGNRPLCPRCAELRKQRIRRNQLRASLHFDASLEGVPAIRVTTPVTPNGSSLIATPEFKQGQWRDASVAQTP